MYRTVGKDLLLSEANKTQKEFSGSEIFHSEDSSTRFDVRLPVNMIEFKKAQEAWSAKQSEVIQHLLGRIGLELVEGGDGAWIGQLHEIVNMRPPNHVDSCTQFAGLTGERGLYPLKPLASVFRTTVNRHMRTRGVKFQEFERRIETPEERQARMDRMFGGTYES